MYYCVMASSTNSSSASTRLNDELFLIGIRNLDHLLKLNQLPTVRQVLLWFHHCLKEVKSVQNASYLKVEEFLTVWSKTAVPATLQTHIVENLEKCHEWLLLKKNKSRKSSEAETTARF